ncbi:RING-H2 finger protein ATL29-like [Ananas comosus]|uniref:RING-type E3 ubiquitin transferase n=1 Tax=Ananas comosus TaxID=4615 RepID=A0A6P5FMC4_ANACO|nr:RING-H2 finger protein ATL29-like [Ananas comosus]
MATPPADRRSLRHPPPPPPPPPPPDLAVAPSSEIPPSSEGRSLSLLLPVLMLFFLLLCFLSIFLLRDVLHFACLSIRRRRRHSRDPSAPAGVGSEGAKAGLDPAILASFPMLPYAAVRGVQEGKCEAECAVCLAEFRGSDAVRLLTVCCHAFHPACIDLWLETHTTCPLCRSDLQAPPDEAAVIAVHEVAVDSSNLNSSGSHTIAIEEAEERSRKSRSSSLSIAIERGEEGGV